MQPDSIWGMISQCKLPIIQRCAVISATCKNWLRKIIAKGRIKPLKQNARATQKTDIMTRTVTVSDQNGTEALAAKLAAVARAGDVILMHGTLGMGKSAFCRAFIRAVADNPHEEVPSPTFTLVQIYELDRVPVWHFDLYRLSDPEEVHELDIEDAFSDAVSLIEWPDRLEYLTPENRLDVHIDPGSNPDGRVFKLEPHGDEWVSRINDLVVDPS